MKVTTFFATTALILAANGAQAYFIDVGTSELNSNSVYDYSGLDNISFDAEFNSNAPISVSVVRQSGDLDNSVSFSSVVSNFVALGWDNFTVSLNGNVNLASTGTVFAFTALEDADNTLASNSATISFTYPETAGFELGDVYGDLGIEPWVIDVSALQIGEAFTIEMAPAQVPLPAAAWLFGSALLGLGALRRR